MLQARNFKKWNVEIGARKGLAILLNLSKQSKLPLIIMFDH